MADQRIDDLTYDPASSNIARNDLVLIQRNNIDYKANFAGALLLPDFDPVNDRNKVLQVNSTGTAASWEANERTNWNLAVHNPRSPGNTAPMSPVTSSGLANYRDLYAIFTLSGGSRYGIEVRRGVPQNISSDGNVIAWLSNNYTTINFSVNGDSVNITHLHVYGRL